MGGTVEATLSDTWTFDGTDWTLQSPSHSPPARDFGGLVALSGNVVLFGGTDQTFATATPDDLFAPTRGPTTGRIGRASSRIGPGAHAPRRAGAGHRWLRDHTSSADTTAMIRWRTPGRSRDRRGRSSTRPPSRPRATAPPWRRTKACCFSSAAKCRNRAPSWNDTWTFDGTTWTALAPAHSPGARNGAVLVPSGSGLMLFGGLTQQLDVLNDTWLWDGTDWQVLEPSSAPPARATACAANVGASAIVFGGGTSTVMQYGDTWAFQGQRWTALSPVTSPGVRAACQFATP